MREPRCLLAGGFALLYILCAPRDISIARGSPIHLSFSQVLLTARLQRSYGRVQDNGRNKGDSAGILPG